MEGNSTNSIMKRKNNISSLFIYIIIFSTGLSAQSDSYKTFIQKTGDVIQIGLPITALMTSGFKKDKAGIKQLFYGFSTTFILTHTLKRVIRKKRPDPSEAYNAFPSGHTSVAFHSAAYLQKRYGWSYGIPAYLLAGFTAYSRVEGIDRKHDFWDVLGGATLGGVSAYVFTKAHKSENVSLSILTTKKNFSLALQLHLN